MAQIAARIYTDGVLAGFRTDPVADTGYRSFKFPSPRKSWFTSTAHVKLRPGLNKITLTWAGDNAVFAKYQSESSPRMIVPAGVGVRTAVDQVWVEPGDVVYFATTVTQDDVDNARWMLVSVEALATPTQ